MIFLGGPAVFIVPRINSAEAEGNLEHHRKFAMTRVITSSKNDVTFECTREHSRTRAHTQIGNSDGKLKNCRSEKNMHMKMTFCKKID